METVTLLLVFTYLLAGATIARMAWEFDAFADRASVQDRRDEAALCWVLVLVWPVVPAWGLWTYVTRR